MAASTSIDDLFNAIDTYMASSGKKTNGKYLASKFSDIFDSPNAPFNAKTGPIKKIVDNFNKFSKKIEEASETFNKLPEKLNDIFTNLDAFSKSLKDSQKMFSDLSKKINGFDLDTTRNAKAIDKTPPVWLEDIIKKISEPKEKDFSDDPVPIKIGSIDTTGTAKAIDKKPPVWLEDVIKKISEPKEKDFSDDPVPIKIVSIDSRLLKNIAKELSAVSANNAAPYRRNGENRQAPAKETTSFIGRIFKWFAGITAVVGTIALLQNTEVGKKISEFFGKMFNVAGKYIGDYIDSGKLKQNVDSFFKGIHDFFSTIKKNISGFFKEHGDELGKIWQTFRDSFWNNILVPFADTLWNFVIKPWFGGMADDLAKGNYIDFIVKAMTTAIVPLIGLSLVPGIGLLVAALTPVLIELAPLAIGLTALGVGIVSLTNLFNTSIDELNKANEKDNKRQQSSMEQDEKYLKMLNKQEQDIIKNEKNPNLRDLQLYKIEKERMLAQQNIEKASSLKKINEDETGAYDNYGSILGGIVNMIDNPSDRKEATLDEYAKKNSIIRKELKEIDKQINDIKDTDRKNNTDSTSTGIIDNAKKSTNISVTIPNIEKITETLNQNTVDNSFEALKPVPPKADNIKVEPMVPNNKPLSFNPNDKHLENLSLTNDLLNQQINQLNKNMARLQASILSMNTQSSSTKQGNKPSSGSDPVKDMRQKTIYHVERIA